MASPCTVHRLAFFFGPFTKSLPHYIPPYSNSLPLILNADSLRESLILVLIPFTHPHSLHTSLVRWLALILSVTESIKDAIKPAEGGQPAERGGYIIEES